jgi:hypothetical protein
VCRDQAARIKHEGKAHKDGWACTYAETDEEGTRIWCRKVLKNRKSFIKHRRTHEQQLDKKFTHVCIAAGCSWGAQEVGALVCHIKNKHPTLPYTPPANCKAVQCMLTNRDGEVCGKYVVSHRYLTTYHQRSLLCKGREDALEEAQDAANVPQAVVDPLPQ